MNKENIKLLQEKISISVQEANQLLEKHQDDIQASVQAFHHHNIQELCAITSCDLDTATESYYFSNFDMKKAIKVIHYKPIIISTAANSNSKTGIGFIIWPEDEDGEIYTTNKRNDIFIPTDDFNYLIQAFKSVFPLVNNWNQTIEDQFDPCGNNYFDNKISKIIVENIRQSISTNNLTIATFQKEVIAWLEERLTYADYIVVYGNL